MDFKFNDIVEKRVLAKSQKALGDIINVCRSYMGETDRGSLSASPSPLHNPEYG